MKISEVKELLSKNPSHEDINALKLDLRQGVQKLLISYEKKIERLAKERVRYDKMLQFEKKFYAEGAQLICGVDEAGRGPLAGPLVIAAVILPRDAFIYGLNDSKQISAKKRQELYDEIMRVALDIEVNIVSVANIDKFNIYRATQIGMEQVIKALHNPVKVALVDAMPLHLHNVKSIAIVHGDALSASIAAASIIAKVTRDKIMDRLGVIYPEYGLERNKGYGSTSHIEAIMKFGATRWHRRSYEPVKSMNLPDVSYEENILFAPQRMDYTYEVTR